MDGIIAQLSGYPCLYYLAKPSLARTCFSDIALRSSLSTPSLRDVRLKNFFHSVLLLCSRINFLQTKNIDMSASTQGIVTSINLYVCVIFRAAGSRWISGMWWFFALIVTSSYTANMSTFISDNRRDTDLQEVKDLADQNKISYGLLVNGSTYQFFEVSHF